MDFVAKSPPNRTVADTANNKKNFRIGEPNKNATVLPATATAVITNSNIATALELLSNAERATPV